MVPGRARQKRFAQKSQPRRISRGQRAVRAQRVLGQPQQALRRRVQALVVEIRQLLGPAGRIHRAELRKASVRGVEQRFKQRLETRLPGELWRGGNWHEHG